jgi:hypothetical protein
MPRPVPIPDNSYGGPSEETNRRFRKEQGTLPGTRVGIPGRSDSSQDSSGKWHPGPIK